MGWPLKEITKEERWATAYSDVATGAFWRIPLSSPVGDKTYGEHYAHFLSSQFRTSERDYVIMVRLPPGAGDFCVDHKPTDSDGGWTVTGELPSITVSPSINAEGSYHGWIQNGVLTDDCEGRTYA